jgi:protein-tyrosine phosphatase
VQIGVTWITKDEMARLALVKEERRTQVFTRTRDPNDNRRQDRVLPESYEQIAVEDAYNEAYAAKLLTAQLKVEVIYQRIPVTDHCVPSDEALRTLVNLRKKVTSTDWVHFHCHGGDGRTTMFLAVYDMLCSNQSRKDLPPWRTSHADSGSCLTTA